MTDEQIIKALEIAKGALSDGDIDMETFTALNNAINFINRQKAENERLEKGLTEYKLRLKMSECTVDEIKSEAIKEFAKYIIDKSQNGIIQVSDIPDYVKEMTEAQE